MATKFYVERSVGLGAAIAIIFLGIGVQAQERIRISYSSIDTSNSIWYVAEEAGFYRKNGLDAELIYIPSTTTSVTSLLAGDVKISNASGGAVTSAAVGGANLVVVGCYLKEPLNKYRL